MCASLAKVVSFNLKYGVGEIDIIHGVDLVVVIS